MAMSEYMRALRAKVGNDDVLVPAAGAFIRDDESGVLLVRHAAGRQLETLDLQETARLTSATCRLELERRLVP
jgi:hypothetical protein